MGGRGLAYTRESDRHMKLVAVADRKKGAQSGPSGLPDISKEKIWKMEKEEVYLFIFCLNIRPFEATFFVMDTLQPGEKTL